jgi:hypothetical protein
MITTAEDIVPGFASLAGPDANYITGATLNRRKHRVNE